MTHLPPPPTYNSHTPTLLDYSANHTPAITAILEGLAEGDKPLRELCRENQLAESDLLRWAANDASLERDLRAAHLSAIRHKAEVRFLAAEAALMLLLRNVPLETTATELTRDKTGAISQSKEKRQARAIPPSISAVALALSGKVQGPTLLPEAQTEAVDAAGNELDLFSTQDLEKLLASMPGGGLGESDDLSMEDAFGDEVGGSV